MGEYDLRSGALCVSGAAPLPREVFERFEALTGGRLVEGYGLTETSPLTHCTPIFGERRPGSIGLPFPDTDARIVDMTTGEPLAPGEEGELEVRGPQVMLGYWGRPEETAEVFHDGWLRTGDVARMDPDGFFHVVDRRKDMIDASGFKVLPREVEEVLLMHPKVREAVVAGVPDAYRGETVKAFVVLKPGETADRGGDRRVLPAAPRRRSRCRARSTSGASCRRRWWGSTCAASWSRRSGRRRRRAP